MSQKKFPFEIRIRLRSFNLFSLDLLKRKFQDIAKNYKLNYSSINLPIEKKKFVVLKSPHVNKKAREQFETRVSNCLIIIKGLVPGLSIYKDIEKVGSEDVLLKLVVLTHKC